jgi:hypothetical protein
VKIEEPHEKKKGSRTVEMELSPFVMKGKQNHLTRSAPQHNSLWMMPSLTPWIGVRQSKWGKVTQS